MPLNFIKSRIPFQTKQRAGRFFYKLFTKKTLQNKDEIQKRFINSSKTKIIVFFDRFPRPDQDSASVRMTFILKGLQEFAEVAFVPVYNRREDSEYGKRLSESGIYIASILEFEDLFKNVNFDYAVFSYPFVIKNALPVFRKNFRRTKIIYDTMDVHFVRLRREAEILKNREIAEEAEKLRLIEAECAANADCVWCVTEADKEFLLTESPNANIDIIPNIHSLNGRGEKFENRKDLFFIGGFKHRPNVDAMVYFVKEIFPLIQAERKDVCLHIVGSYPTEEIKNLATENVSVHGFVEDVSPFFEMSRVCVAPLRYGGGMKGKIGQALSYGLPTVTTSVGAEGMNLRDGGEVLIADDAETFARAVCRLYDNAKLWQNLSDQGFRFIASNFAPEIIYSKIRRSLEDIEGKKFLK